MYTSPSIVFGFHGCDQSVADKILKMSDVLAPSEKAYDWLGHGIYFWEGSESRALDWAKSKKNIKAPAVIGAIIRLGNCLDLLDDRCIRALSTTYEMLVAECAVIGEVLPENKKVDANGISFIRDLDCKVVMRLHEMNNDQIAQDLNLKNTTSVKNKKAIQTHPEFIDSVRGMFPEGNELYLNAGFRAANHIQLCVVNPNCILGYFNPREPDPKFKIF
jgi:hypothetical protein